MKKNDSLNSRIVLRMRELNIKNKDLVKATGASKGTVSQWINGGNQPSAKYVASLALVLEVNEKWLLEGGVIEHKKERQTSLRSIKRIPLLSLQQAGEWSHIIMDNRLTHFNTWINTADDAPRFAFAVEIEGDSMVQTNGSAPSISEGSIVIIDPEFPLSSGLIVAAKLKGTDKITIKKLVIDGPNIYLVPFNQNYKSIQIDNLESIVGVCIRSQINLV